MIGQKQDITNELKDRVCNLHKKGSESKDSLIEYGLHSKISQYNYIFTNNNKALPQKRLNRIYTGFYVKYD